MRTVLVTGGSGFIGANLARKLLSSGFQVHLLLRSGFTTWRLTEILDHIIIHEVDLEDDQKILNTVQQIKPDWVFHLATSGAYSWQNNIHQIINTNIYGTINLLDASLQAGCEVFINTGSSSEYGKKSHAPNETEWIDPNSYYAISKAFGTQYCRHISMSQKRNIYTLRLYSVYGPFEDPNRFIPTLIVNAFEKRLPPLVSPKIARDFIYVDDVVDAYLRLASSTDIEFGSVYNVGSGRQTTIDTVVQLSKQFFEINQEPEWGTFDNRSWDTSIWQADIQRIQNALEWHPKHDLEQGFAKTVDWFKANPKILNYYQIEIRNRTAAS
jgi:UDP-glucose 4-epimerase